MGGLRLICRRRLWGCTNTLSISSLEGELVLAGLQCDATSLASAASVVPPPVPEFVYAGVALVVVVVSTARYSPRSSSPITVTTNAVAIFFPILLRSLLSRCQNV